MGRYVPSNVQAWGSASPSPIYTTLPLHHQPGPGTANPNGWAIQLGLWYIWWGFNGGEESLLLDVGLFFTTHLIKRYKDSPGQYYISVRNTFCKLVDSPSANKHWQNRCFFVSGGWLVTRDGEPYCQMPSQFGEVGTVLVGRGH